jgi:chloramphenicol-sensitive protein RarD
VSLSSEQRAGGAYALGAYVFWGLAPLYYPLVASVAPTEMLVYRVWLAAFTLLPFLFAFRLMPEIRALLKEPRTLMMLAASGFLIACNWLAFMWAMVNERVIETRMGYFMCPLMYVLLGVVILGERLRPAQTFSVLLAALAVVLLIFNRGAVPWVALTLPFAFGLYGLIHKKLTVHPFTSLFVEVLFLAPFVSLYGLYLLNEGTSIFFQEGLRVKAYLLFLAPITVIPLVLFGAAVSRITLTVMGIFQYVAPSISFIVGVFVLKETFDSARFISFAII